MSDSWVSVIYDESDPSDEAIEVQTEPDGTVLLSSIVQQFPGVTGLKFRNPDSTKKGFRMVRVVPNEHTSVLYPPSAEDGWGDVTYFCVKPKATKVAEAKPIAKNETKNDKKSAEKRPAENAPAGEEGSEGEKPQDLIVLSLPWATTDEGLKTFFEQFGQVESAKIKTDNNGKGKGFGFIRFRDLSVQKKVLLIRHEFNGRMVDVKIPDSVKKKEAQEKFDKFNCKIYVANCHKAITEDDLKSHFNEFGNVTEVYIPKQHKNYAFVVFDSAKTAMALIGKEHEIKGYKVFIKPVTMKDGGGGGGPSGGMAMMHPHHPHGGPPMAKRMDFGHQHHQQDPYGGYVNGSYDYPGGPMAMGGGGGGPGPMQRGGTFPEGVWSSGSPTGNQRGGYGGNKGGGGVTW